MKIDIKQVIYYGHTLSVPSWVNWLTTDADGAVWAWRNKPEADLQNEAWGASGYLCVHYVGMARDLDVVWQDTKVKV